MAGLFSGLRSHSEESSDYLFIFCVVCEWRWGVGIDNSGREGSGMNFADVVRHYKPDATEHDIDFTIWNDTCFPFGKVRQVVRQIHSSVRAARNGIERCELCLMAIPHHGHGCLEVGRVAE